MGTTDLKVWETQLTFSILISMTIVYCLYHFKYLIDVPCKNSFINVVLRNFIHTNTFHFISNLAGLIILYKVESSTGFNHFALIFLSLLFINSIIEWVLYQYTNMKCSIGLSGIIFGFAVFELMNVSNCTLSALIGLVAMITLPSIKNSDVSVLGHLIGVVSGMIIGMIYRCFLKK